MKRAARALLVLALAVAASIEPIDPGRPHTAAEAARRWIHPMTVEYVYYSFQIDEEGLPRRMFHPRPRDIDVTYRDLDTGRLVTEYGVDWSWGVTFDFPELSKGSLRAVAHGGDNMWCAFEVYHSDGSGWAVSDNGRRRCRVKRKF